MGKRQTYSFYKCVSTKHTHEPGMKMKSAGLYFQSSGAFSNTYASFTSADPKGLICICETLASKCGC